MRLTLQISASFICKPLLAQPNNRAALIDHSVVMDAKTQSWLARVCILQVGLHNESNLAMHSSEDDSDLDRLR